VRASRPAPDARLDGQAHGLGLDDGPAEVGGQPVTSSQSARRIDAAVAAVMAVHRAAELAGVRKPSIYI
jgi:hypothetical protein